MTPEAKKTTGWVLIGFSALGMTLALAMIMVGILKRILATQGEAVQNGEILASSLALSWALIGGLVCFGVMCLLFHILPPFVAFSRKHPNAPAICILTLLLGWTFVGWAIALIWAFTAVKPEPPADFD